MGGQHCVVGHQLDSSQCAKSSHEYWLQRRVEIWHRMYAGGTALSLPAHQRSCNQTCVLNYLQCGSSSHSVLQTSWLTPVELFKPWCSGIARFIVRQHVRHQMMHSVQARGWSGRRCRYPVRHPCSLCSRCLTHTAWHEATFCNSDVNTPIVRAGKLYPRYH
jgi:hypothetical protein